jgi:hypothetical protein
MRISSPGIPIRPHQQVGGISKTLVLLCWMTILKMAQRLWIALGDDPPNFDASMKEDSDDKEVEECIGDNTVPLVGVKFRWGSYW